MYGGVYTQDAHCTHDVTHTTRLCGWRTGLGLGLWIAWGNHCRDTTATQYSHVSRNFYSLPSLAAYNTAERWRVLSAEVEHYGERKTFRSFSDLLPKPGHSRLLPSATMLYPENREVAHKTASRKSVNQRRMTPTVPTIHLVIRHT